MEKLLRKERLEFRTLLRSLYPDKYIRVRKNGTVVIKNKFYSLSSIKLSYKEAICDLVIRCFSALFVDTKSAFERYYNTIDYSNKKGYGAIRYLCDEYLNLNPNREEFSKILSSKYKMINVDNKTFLLSHLSKTFLPNRNKATTMKALPMGEKSQLLIPFEDLISNNRSGRIVAVVTTGNPEWDKEMEKVIRFNTFF